MNDIVYGRIPVLTSLEEGQVLELFLSENFSGKEILDLAKKQNIQVNYVTKSELRNLTKGNHQGVVAKVKRFEYTPLDKSVLQSKRSKFPLFLMLDEINDPHNFGAIIRIADAYRVDGIIIKNRRQVEVTPTVIKVATGAQVYVPIIQVSNLTNALNALKKEGFWIIASDGNAKKSHVELDYDFPLVLVIGSEGYGISNLLLKNADYTVKIPMYGHVNSLNASVATGIILDQIRNKQRL